MISLRLEDEMGASIELVDRNRDSSRVSSVVLALAKLSQIQTFEPEWDVQRQAEVAAILAGLHSITIVEFKP